MLCTFSQVRHLDRLRLPFRSQSVTDTLVWIGAEGIATLGGRTRANVAAGLCGHVAAAQQLNIAIKDPALAVTATFSSRIHTPRGTMDRVNAMLHPQPARQSSQRRAASPHSSPPAQIRHSNSMSSTHSHHSSMSTATAQNFPGGFQPPRTLQPPPGADPELWRVFTSVDQDASGAISATELQAALVNGNLSRAFFAPSGGQNI